MIEWTSPSRRQLRKQHSSRRILSQRRGMSIWQHRTESFVVASLSCTVSSIHAMGAIQLYCYWPRQWLNRPMVLVLGTDKKRTDMGRRIRHFILAALVLHRPLCLVLLNGRDSLHLSPFHNNSSRPPKRRQTRRMAPRVSAVLRARVRRYRLCNHEFWALVECHRASRTGRDRQVNAHLVRRLRL